MSRRAVFLDRDGVLSRALDVDGQPRTPMRAAEFEVLPGAASACERLKHAGFVLVVVTNQPDVARGLLPVHELEAMHAALRGAVAVDDIGVCPHDNHHHCGCRKPAPGMLTKAAQDFGLDLDASFMVGDRWRDIECGRRAGCRTVLVDRGWREQSPPPATAVVAGVLEAARWIVEFGGSRQRGAA